MFEAAYNSSWQNPIFFWVAAAVLLGLLALNIRRTTPWVRGYALFFAIAIAVDALASGGFSPTAGTALATPIAIAFVIMGDWRYFLLVERHARSKGSGTPPSAIAASLAFAFVVPVLSAIAGEVLPDTFGEARVRFLAYELTFMMLALVLRFIVLPGRLEHLEEAPRAWLLRVTMFEVIQYALWATADVVILTAGDVGYLLRFVPNAMYYALFVPFVYLTAPAEDG